MLSLLLLSFIACKGVIGDTYIINNAQDLIEFSNSTNSGKSYNGTTVYLNSDIDFDEELSSNFTPINSFNGTFDGQGYRINNLAISTSSLYSGLFGHTGVLNVKNVILDSSCTVVNLISGYEATIYNGGIAGYCHAVYGPCIIENSVNMANVSFKGNMGYGAKVIIGGIVGHYSRYSYYKYKLLIKNCANYGPLALTVKSYDTYIGGIVGTSSIATIQNCLNYGDIIHSGSTSFHLYIGGISGYSEGDTIENCASYFKRISGGGYTGGIAGKCEYSTISHSYWSETFASYGISDRYYYIKTLKMLSYSSNLELSEKVSIGNYKGNSLIEALSAYSEYHILNNYSGWILNKDEKSIKFKINNRNENTFNAKILILPSLSGGSEYAFDGWYSDNTYKTQFTEIEVNSDKIFYGKWGDNSIKYTITFDTEGGSSINSLSYQAGSFVTLPNTTTKDHCTIEYWETDKGYKMPWSFYMPGRKIALHAAWRCTHITTAKDLIDFSKFVNSGTSYSGTTVYLDSDFDFSGKLSEQFEIIGNSTDFYFNGTFDGQGHTISNLKMESSSEYIGLFGYSKGSTIMNIVIDDSCSFTGLYNISGYLTSTCMGGVIGYCVTKTGPCNIANNVNMGSVTFSEIVDTSYTYLGGLVGNLNSDKYGVYIKNCANYGSVTHSGTCNYAYTGGVIGTLTGYTSSNNNYILNCFNSGNIVHNGVTTKELYIGGISGSSFSTVNNCVNHGKITSSNTSNYIGSITGYFRGSSISHCYWSEDSGYDVYGTINQFSLETSNNAVFNTNFELNESISVGGYTGKSLIKALNACSEYHSLRDYSYWILNKGGKSVSFKMNGSKGFALNSKIILLPNLLNGRELPFDSWYTDSGLSSLFTKTEVDSNTELYGKFREDTKSYTITFITRKTVSVKPVSSKYYSVVSLPKGLTSDGCTLAFWETEYGDNVPWQFTMPAKNVTLCAVWKCTHITNTKDFIDFSRFVNSGTSYSYTTVYLDSDIDLADSYPHKFEQIGKDDDNYFEGTFDGQGHSISNLALISTDAYTGLFRVTESLSVINLVIDESCSIVSSYSSTSSSAYVGGILGYCDGKWPGCNIENTVNLANVTFNGNVLNKDAYLGGFIGYLYNHIKGTTIKNCANYGSITYSGVSGNSYIGGIVGGSTKSSLSKYYNYIYNSLNHGDITYEGVPSYRQYIGGIIGRGLDVYIENCVNSGTITSNTTSNLQIGTIAESSLSISHCYWTVETEYSGSFSDSQTIDAETSYAVPSTELLKKLNIYSANYSWNGWLLNKNKAPVSFKINRGKGYTVNSPLVLVHDLVKGNDRKFSEWYKDAALTEQFTGNEVESDITLHGMWICIIVFDFMNSTEIEKMFGYGDVITYPENVEMEGYIFVGWSESMFGSVVYDRTTAVEDVTLYPIFKEISSDESKGGSGEEGKEESSVKRKEESGKESESKQGSLSSSIYPLTVLIFIFSILVF